MTRRRFTVPRLSCLAVCILTVVLWIRSHRTTDDWLLIYKTDGSERVSSLNGDIMIRHERPSGGKFGGLQRITHRSDRVTALPPRPWREDLLETHWGLFRWINIPPPSPGAIQQAKQTYGAMLTLQQANASAPTSGPALNAQAAGFMQLNMLYERQKRMLDRERYWELVFPLWLVPTVFSLPVLLAGLLTLLRGRRRIRQGLCPACGYDLRGSSDRCPECGKSFEVLSLD